MNCPISAARSGISRPARWCFAELRTENDEVEPRIVALDVLALAEGVELDSNALPVA